MMISQNNLIGAGSALAGLGFCYSGYQSYKEGDKAKTMLKVAAGVAMFAVAYTFIEALSEPECQLERLHSLLQKDDEIALTKAWAHSPAPKDITGEKFGTTWIRAYFDKLNGTKEGITCNNYLPWQDRFNSGTGYIDGIKPQDVKQSLSWGIDPESRPFIAVKHVCPNGDVGVASLYKRYDWNPQEVTTGGHFRAKCFFRPRLVSDHRHFDDISLLFKNRRSLFDVSQDAEGYDWQEAIDFQSTMTRGMEAYELGRVSLYEAP